MDPHFRIASQTDLRLMADWAAAEGWNPGLDDAAPFHAADPAGFFLAEVGGRPVACISVVNHGPDAAFLGFYICHPDWRGQGIGKALWDHALAHAGARVVGLDGVAAQEANYALSGFVRAGASRRFTGPLEPEAAGDVRAVTAADLPELLALDAAACGYRREAFLSVWVAPAETRRTVRDGAEGFATIRRCREGVKIGPIIAGDPAQAMRLAHAALAELPSDQVYIDTAAGSPLADHLRALGWQETFATARMYRGAAPEGSGRLMAIASMELG